jgi:hypothetical protein
MKLDCYHCGKPGQFKKDCCFLKKKQRASDLKEFVAMIFEICMLKEDGSWWIDSYASEHVCKEKSLFKNFETLEDGESEKVLTLTYVYYVLEIRKNLVSRGLLSKFRFKCVFKSDQFVLTKGDFLLGNVICLRLYSF